MKKILVLLIAMLVIAISAQAKEVDMEVYDFEITRVIDGDTVAFRADFLPAPLKQELSIRVYGVDTPEKSLRYMLIENGFAREYYGTKKETWCN